MKKLFATTLLSAAVAFTAQAQNVTGTIHANQGKQKINKEIYPCVEVASAVVTMNHSYE